MIEKRKPRSVGGQSEAQKTNWRAVCNQSKPVHSLPASQGECLTCGASAEFIEWRDMRREPSEFAHAVRGRMVPFCSCCDRPWFRGSRDPRLWKGAHS